MQHSGADQFFEASLLVAFDSILLVRVTVISVVSVAYSRGWFVDRHEFERYEGNEGWIG